MNELVAHPTETRLALRAAFLGGLPLEAAAAKAGIPEQTARRWKSEAKTSGDDWDKFQRASLIVAGGGFEAAMGRVAAAVILRAEALLEQIAADTELDPIDATKAVGSLADSLAKAQAASKRLMPETDKLAVAGTVLKLLSAFIQEKYPQHIGAFADVLEPFGREVARSLD